MARKIDSDALDPIGGALGLSGGAAQETVLLDETAPMVLTLNDFVRRGRSHVANQGMNIGIMRHNHPGADSQGSSVDPYAVGAGSLAPWPTPLPPDLDVWLMGAGVHQSGGAGTLTASLSINWGINTIGWSQDEAGAAELGSDVITLAFWDALITQGDEFGITAGGELPWVRIGLRIPKNTPRTVLQFSSTSSAAAIFDLQLLLGLFPKALGQDAIA